jgi:hypothetical protein
MNSSTQKLYETLLSIRQTLCLEMGSKGYDFCISTDISECDALIDFLTVSGVTNSNSPMPQDNEAYILAVCIRIKSNYPYLF